MTTNTNSSQSIGELIRNYRLEKGLNQIDLEVGIDAAFGSISKIESGKTNPSKETLHKIIEFLDLPPVYALKLFNIDMSFLGAIVDQLKRLKDVKELDEVMSIAMNEVRLQLGLAGGAFYLIDDNQLSLRSLSSTYFMSLVRRIVKNPYGMLKFHLTNHPENILVQAVLGNEIVITNDLYDMVRPQMSKWLSDRAQKITFTKQVIGIPIQKHGKVAGLITYGSLTGNNFRFEIEPLKAFVEEVGIAIERLLPN